MLPLFDMMMKAQNGNAVDEMAKQFGLAQEQMTQAMAALMPAFSTGLKRSAASPYDFSALLGTASSGNYGRYFEDMTKAFTPEGISDGNSVLAKIFGSKDVSRAIAAQAEQMNGISQDVYKQMLPVIANTMMGGFFKQIADQFQTAGEAISAGRPADIFQPWLQAAGLQEKPKPAAPSLFDNPFTQSLQALFTQGQANLNPAKANAQATNMFANNPFLQMMQSMSKPQAADGESVGSEATAGTTPDANAFGGVINQMFESGIDVQKNYQKSMDSIFDAYMSGFKPLGKDGA